MPRRFPVAGFLALAILLATSDCQTTKSTKQTRKRDQSATEDASLNRVLSPRGICQSNEFQCSPYSRCISLDQVCDTRVDCSGGADEQNCPTDCTGQNQFKCENSDKCIGIVDKCDGTPDCTDYSDEAFCGTVECAAGRFKCTESQECISALFVCDREADCQDGSDERNCINGTCSSYQWQCADKDRCISHSFVCDGDHDCLDRSDETGCTCPGSHFQCTNGICVPANFKCDGDNDCGDQSDEMGCPALPTYTCRDVLTFEDCFRVNETTHPICSIPADADKLCRKFCGLCLTL